MGAQRLGEDPADGSGAGPFQEPRGHTEAGMVIDAGQGFEFGPVGELYASHHVELPELHRAASFPAPVVLPASPPRPRRDQPVTNERSIHR